MVWSGPEWSFSSCPLSGRLTLSISLSQSSETRTQSDSHHRIAQVSEPLTIKVNPGKFPSEEFCFRASLFNQRFLHIMHIALPCRFICSIFFLICNSELKQRVTTELKSAWLDFWLQSHHWTKKPSFTVLLWNKYIRSWNDLFPLLREIFLLPKSDQRIEPNQAYLSCSAALCSTASWMVEREGL